MSDFISPILQWINLHPQLAGLATFIISAAESVAIIGTIVPGTVMMTAVGTLAGAGVMPLWSTLLWAILGAIVGDGISYWVGYYYKDRIRDIWPFRTNAYLLATGEKFFRKHGGKSVFIGRFVGPVRALVPLVAGMLGMKPWRFTIANVTSAIGWAPAYTLPGIALGAASLELPPDIAVHAILMLLLVGLFIILCLWFLQKIFLLLGKQLNHSLTKLWGRLNQSRYFSVLTFTLKHHNAQKTYGQLTLAFYFVIASVCFLYLAAYVYLHGSQDIFLNNFFFHLFRSLRTPTGDNVMLAITFFGESKMLLAILGCLFVWLAWNKRWRTAWHVLALGIITSIGVDTFKYLVHSARPWGIEHSPAGASFPSGHTTFSMAFYAGLALLIVKRSRRLFRRIAYSLAAIIIIAIGISRMYLGAHWLTDVVGGLLLGTAILMLVILSYNRHKEKLINRPRMITAVVLAFLVIYGAYSYHFFPTYKKNYAQIDWPTQTIELNTWWNQKGDNLPLYRTNRFGFSTQILNLQWVGDLATIQAELCADGWKVPPTADWITVLHRVSDVQSAEHLPLVSALYLDKTPVLILIKHASNKKLIVLRLWNPNTNIQNVAQPLWVGTVDLAPRTYSWLFKTKHNNDINLTPNQLFTKVPSDLEVKAMTVQNTHRRHTEDQTLLLIKPKGL